MKVLCLICPFFSLLAVYSLFSCMPSFAMSCPQSVSDAPEVRSSDSSLAKIESTNLNYATQSLHGKGLMVPEGELKVVSGKELGQYKVLFTKNLFSCLAIFIRDRRTNTTLLSHFRTDRAKYGDKRGISNYTGFLAEHFIFGGGKFSQSDITIVVGRYSRDHFADRIQRVITELTSFKPNSIRVDATEGQEGLSGEVSVYQDLSSFEIVKADRYQGDPGLIDSFILDRTGFGFFENR